MPRAKLRQIVGRLPERKSSIECLVAELREYGARFRNDLLQDELGPTPAERAAARKEALQALKEAQSAMEGLRSNASQVLANASTLATGDYAAADSAARFEAAKRAPEWLWLAAMEAAGDLHHAAVRQMQRRLRGSSLSHNRPLYGWRVWTRPGTANCFSNG
jgi:hypothetical protein